VVDVEHTERGSDKSNEEEDDLERDFSLLLNAQYFHVVLTVNTGLCEAVSGVVVGVVCWVEVLLPLFGDANVVIGVGLPLVGDVGVSSLPLCSLSGVDSSELIRLEELLPFVRVSPVVGLWCWGGCWSNLLNWLLDNLLDWLLDNLLDWLLDNLLDWCWSSSWCNWGELLTSWFVVSDFASSE